MIPKYINCKTNEEVCDYYLTSQCKETCVYSKDIRGIGIGAMRPEDIGRLEKEILND